MATTTPNFGWTVPTSSDLVKNGAVAIETLGDAIDASLVDLKGGTTGQILSKASGTDMDFTWASPSAGGGITLISSTTLSGSGITLSSIPSTYKNLYLELSEFYCNQTYDAVYVRFNGDSSGAYDWGYLGSQNTSTDFANNTQSTEIQLSSNTNNTNRWEKGSAYLQIQNYAQATVPVYFWGNGRVVQATNKKSQNIMGQYRNGSVVSSIYIYTSSGTWSGGTVKLYGVN